MEENNSNIKHLCTKGCGFYGNSQYEGMCSKCYSDMVKRQSHTDARPPRPSSSSSPMLMDIGVAMTSGGRDTTGDTPIRDKLSDSPLLTRISVTNKLHVSEPAVFPNEPSTDSHQTSSLASSPGPSRKINRCDHCKKKVGLTGLQCRCGGVYCSTHRYSDKHSCTFDYQREGQEEIRRSNPEVVATKVKRL